MPAKANGKGPAAKGQVKAVGSKEPSVQGNSKSTGRAPQAQPHQINASDASNPKPAPPNAADASVITKAQSTTPIAEPSTGNSVKEATVNRKKQKRRNKEAAKRAAEQQNSEASRPANSYGAREQANGYEYPVSDYEDPEQYDADDADDVYYTDEATQQNYLRNSQTTQLHLNGHTNHDIAKQESLNNKSKKKKKNKGNPSAVDDASRPPLLPARRSQSYLTTSQGANRSSKDRIWNTSTAEERERIKEFWLSLGEDDRRSLVKVEKEAVLKKMKEQQKHSCSCTVCGRKRTAIEEELEVLYDAYYEELEQYANHQQTNAEDGTPIIPSSRMYPHPMSRPPLSRQPQSYNRRSSSARVREIGDEDDGIDDEEDSEVGEDDEFSDEYLETETEPTPAATDFFNFGNSLTVQGGILTVADDLLKNDGKKFIEMMEQLAERRMQREEESQYPASAMNMQHNHASALEDEMYEEDEEEDDYDSAEDEEYDEDDMETMTEEQRMEEGRRMFQIFAARMFEQRVLTAYREKVALERQQKLIEELDDESRIDAQREAKKAKEAQKKKDKKRQQKQARDEEKAKREAEKAAEEAAAKALEEKKAEELRLKKEEQRKKREAERKLQEEERAKKEAEKQKRLQEARDQQAEQERKQREQKERDKKKRDEVKRKERDEREAKEKEAREKRDRETTEKRDLEAKVLATNPANSSKEIPSKHQSSISKTATQTAPGLPKKPSSAASITHSSAPSGLQPPVTSSSHTSPHLAIATPVIPKAPTPVRPRQPSFQDSRATSPRTSLPTTSSAASPKGAVAQHNGTSSGQTTRTTQPTPPQGFQAQFPYSPKNTSPGSVTRPPGFPNMPPASGTGFASTFGPTISEVINPFSSMAPGNPTGPTTGNQQSVYMPVSGVPFGPGTNDTAIVPQGRGKMEPPPNQPSAIGRHPPSFGEIGHPGPSRESIASQSHSRNTSTSSNVAAQTQPIARPAPIQRPSSTTPQQQGGHGPISRKDVDDLTNHLGSKALLDDDDDIPLTSPIDDARRGNMAIGGPRGSRANFAGPPGLPDPIGTTRHDNQARGLAPGSTNTWSTQQSAFNNSASPWPSNSGFGRANAGNGFGSIGNPSHQQSAARAVLIRNLTANTCQKLSARSPNSPLTSWHRAEEVLRDVQMSRPQHVAPINREEMLELCGVAGNSQNGGGTFELAADQTGVHIRFSPHRNSSMGPVAGEIGNPVGSGSAVFGGPSRSFQAPGGFPPSTGF